MHEPIDLIAHAAIAELRRYSRRTGQPTSIELMDVDPLQHVHNIDITEEHVTIQYSHDTKHRYNANEISYKEWSYKYNDDPEFVRAIAAVIGLARKHLLDMPENASCPPGCAQCCSGYEPFVSRADVERMAASFKMTYQETLDRYVVQRESADGFVVGYLRKVTDDIASQCVFLKGRESGDHYCGIYDARPHDCRPSPRSAAATSTRICHAKAPIPSGPRSARAGTLREEASARAVTYDAIVVGAGHNGLIAAALPRARPVGACSCSSGARSSEVRASPRPSGQDMPSRRRRTSAACSRPKSSASSA